MQAAILNGYTKIVLGTCTSQIACHVLEATVKVPPQKKKKNKTQMRKSKNK